MTSGPTHPHLAPLKHTTHFVDRPELLLRKRVGLSPPLPPAAAAAASTRPLSVPPALSLLLSPAAVAAAGAGAAGGVMAGRGGRATTRGASEVATSGADGRRRCRRGGDGGRDDGISCSSGSCSSSGGGGRGRRRARGWKQRGWHRQRQGQRRRRRFGLDCRVRRVHHVGGGELFLARLERVDCRVRGDGQPGADGVDLLTVDASLRLRESLRQSKGGSKPPREQKEKEAPCRRAVARRRPWIVHACTRPSNRAKPQPQPL